jgi:anti-sigma-K factor RskA
MTDVPNGGHERWEGDAAAYALGALEQADMRAFEEHLAACSRCQDELAVMRRAVEGLPAAPRVDPGPELKQRVMATVRAEAEVRTASEPPARRPFGAPSWLRPVGAGALAAAALAVVLVLTIGGGSSARTYAGIVYAPGAHASVRESGGSAQLRFSSLPAPPPGRIYEVWLTRAGSPPQPARALFDARTGSVAVHGNLRGVRSVQVTAEPRPNGSLAPTRAPIIVVRLV